MERNKYIKYVNYSFVSHYIHAHWRKKSKTMEISKKKNKNDSKRKKILTQNISQHINIYQVLYVIN